MLLDCGLRTGVVSDSKPMSFIGEEMRPLEALLLIVNFLTLFALAVPRLRAVCRMGYSALIALSIAVAQFLAEGPRWQIVPAYALTGLFFLVWMLQNRTRVGEPTGCKWIKRIAISLAAATLAISIALPIVVPVFSFPHPSGPYAIGTLTYHWIDENRLEFFSADPSARRELMVQIYYPARGNPSSSRAPYVPNPEVLASTAHLLRLPAFVFGHFKDVVTNATLSAPMEDGEPMSPVLIFLSGRGGYRQSNTFQIEEVVSHGYRFCRKVFVEDATGPFRGFRLCGEDRELFS